MSKYTLKLEQLIQTAQFDDVLVTIQYDGTGPKLVTLLGENITFELKHTVEMFLGMVNFMLNKKITPLEISEFLEKEPNNGYHSALNDINHILAFALKEAPSNILDLDLRVLMEVEPEMIKEYTQTIIDDREQCENINFSKSSEVRDSLTKENQKNELEKERTILNQNKSSNKIPVYNEETDADSILENQLNLIDEENELATTKNKQNFFSALNPS